MNKREHILNGVLVGLGVALLLNYAVGAPTIRSILSTVVEVAVPASIGALIPDWDTEFGRHRKTLHNLPVLGGFIAFPYVFGNLHYVWIGVLSHILLDAFGSGRGVALWYPFSADEWNPINGPATKSRLAGPVTILITTVELLVAGVVIIGSA